MITMKKTKISLEWQEWNKEPDASALAHAASILSFSEAEAAYRLLIDQGSILSMVNLGSRYEYRSDSDGGPDFAQAEFWYHKAIEAGSAVATLPVGYFYLRRKNYEEAREVFSIGRDRDYAPSILRLGDLYAKGLGVERNYDIAQDFFKQAACRGNLWAKRTAAVLAFRRSRDIVTRFGWWMLVATSYLEFRYQKWREPRSERLKK
ncbi:tetratricopeptide repeat protein [Caballeronia sp. KNU42]